MSKLVLIEWLDSAQPSPGWLYTNDLPSIEPVYCRSIGWLVAESENVVMLAPNMGEVGTDAEQGCGFIRIARPSIKAIHDVTCPCLLFSQPPCP